MIIKIGVDLRGTLAKPEPEKGINCSSKDYARAAVMDNALEVLMRLKKNKGAEIFLVPVIKPAKPKIAMAAGRWLERNNILNQLEISMKDIFICSARDEKALVAARLRLTHFVDDRLSVLQYFPYSVKTYCFSPQEERKVDFPNCRAKIVQSWLEVEQDILL